MKTCFEKKISETFSRDRFLDFQISRGPNRKFHFVILHFAVYFIFRHFTGHLPTENGLPPYSTSSTAPSVPVSNATSSNNIVQNSTSEHHNVNRLSTSPSLSVNSGPSPIPTNAIPPHLEPTSTVTPLKNVSQNQDSLEKVALDASHIESSRRKYWKDFY